MATDLTITTPVDDYELIDFGDGRKLERFGPYLLDRPEPRARGARALEHWQPDWSYTTVAATGQWTPGADDLPRSWPIRVEGHTLEIHLGKGPDVGFDPEQIACWRWVRERIAGCYHIEELRVLNLFGGVGGASAAAQASGAAVTHVDADPALLERAQNNVDGEGVEWVQENTHAYVDQALRSAAAFDLLLVRPRARVRGPHGRAWDTSCDLNPLLTKLPRLVSSQCRGLWLAPREAERGKEWNAETLGAMLRETFPGRRAEAVRLGISTAAGRVLPAGGAVYWYDDEADLPVNGQLPALDAVALEERLDVYLDPVLSSRRTASGPARALARFARPQQDFVLRWVEVVCRTNAELAYQFAANAPQAADLMDEEQMEQWLLAAMDAYDTTGLRPAVTILQGVVAFAEELQAKQSGVAFDEAAPTLELFVHGLNGRKLKLEPGSMLCTDTETLYLPALVNRFDNRADNFTLYKVMATQLWAQTWFGTFHVDLDAALGRYPDREHALRCFEVLERLRLDACLARELPGLAREAKRLLATAGEDAVPAGMQGPAARLQRPEATAATSVDALSQVYGEVLPAPVCYQWSVDPVRVAQVQAARAERERSQFQVMLARMIDEADGPAGRAADAPAPEIAINREAPDAEAGSVQFTVDGRPMAPPAEARGLISSIIQDFGDIPPEYLVAAGPGGYKPDPREPEDKSHDVWKGTYHEEGAFLYNEWDHKRQHYRKNWCVLRESDVSPRGDGFVARTLGRYGGLIKNIRRTFEVLRGEEKLLKRQSNGDDVDIDALVEAYGDVSSGLEMTDRLLTRKQKIERNIAVMFMVDMSGSTKGWINDAERESLILLCEALESLGDRYAIYGFSGMTRKRCELYRIKRFDEAYSDTVRARISGVSPQDYTRMGVVIRHLTELLNQVDARTRVLVTLSDGKPDDFDGYRGEYGIEDTRMALIEAKRVGIHPFCITIDTEAHDYLPHMYGAVNYTVIDDVRKLPLRVSDIYRKLTT